MEEEFKTAESKISPFEDDAIPAQIRGLDAKLSDISTDLDKSRENLKDMEEMLDDAKGMIVSTEKIAEGFLEDLATSEEDLAATDSDLFQAIVAVSARVIQLRGMRAKHSHDLFACVNCPTHPSTPHQTQSGGEETEAVQALRAKREDILAEIKFNKDGLDNLNTDLGDYNAIVDDGFRANDGFEEYAGPNRKMAYDAVANGEKLVAAATKKVEDLEILQSNTLAEKASLEAELPKYQSVVDEYPEKMAKYSENVNKYLPDVSDRKGSEWRSGRLISGVCVSSPWQDRNYVLNLPRRPDP